MEAPTILSLVLGSTAGGAIIVKLIDWAREAAAGRMTQRRAEVDAAIKERDIAKARADVAEDEAEDLKVDRDALREYLHIHRRLIIDAPCLGPDRLPPISDAARGSN